MKYKEKHDFIDDFPYWWQKVILFIAFMAYILLIISTIYMLSQWGNSM